MKKILIAFVASATLLGSAATLATPVAHAQGVTFQQIVELFISLGIIPADKAAIAEAAVGITAAPSQKSVTENPLRMTTTSNDSGAPIMIPTLVGSPTITLIQTPTQNNVSTTTVEASFLISIDDTDADNIYLNQASSSTFSFGIFKDGVRVYPNVASSTAWSIPASAISPINPVPSTLVLGLGETVQIPVTFTFTNRGADGSLINTGTGSYVVGLDRINFNLGNSTSSDYFLTGGDLSWRTASLALTGVQNQPNTGSGPVYVASTPTSTPTLVASSINPTTQTVSSGSNIQLNFTFPSNTVRAGLYLSCPSGITMSIAKLINGCNTYTDVTGSQFADFILLNNTSQPLTAVPNYYIYTSDNPNFAKGVSASVTVLGNQAIEPTINFMSPTGGASGTLVTVNGSNFDASTKILIGNPVVATVTPTYLSPTETQLYFIFPATISTSQTSYPVAVSTTNGMSNAMSFNIIQPQTTPVPVSGGGSGPSSSPTAYYHSADINHDWKIDSTELARVQTLYNYHSGTVRTGQYHCASGTVDGYDVGPGDESCAPHSADENKDWQINLAEFSRVIELSNASGGYTDQQGTEDGFTPVTSSQ